MTLLERAKRFLAQKASRLAVVVVPLAAVALSSSPAKAGSITLTSGSGCVLDVCTVSTGTGGGYSGMNSIDLSTSGSVTAFHIGDYQLDFSANGGVTGGSGSISPGTEIPVSWDFVLLNPQLDPTVTWNITFSLNDGSGDRKRNTPTLRAGRMRRPSRERRFRALAISRSRPAAAATSPDGPSPLTQVRLEATGSTFPVT